LELCAAQESFLDPAASICIKLLVIPAEAGIQDNKNGWIQAKPETEKVKIRGNEHG
jgi:hypothetical protein